MRTMFLKALIGFAAYDVLGLGRRFARLHRTVRHWPISNTPQPADLVARVCDAVNVAAAWYPKRALCLQRAVVTTCLLRSLGVPAVMVLGAQKLPFKAHAWVEIGGRPINERVNVQEVYGVWERC
jgi:hypothetical protein